MHENQPQKLNSAEDPGLRYPAWQVPLQELILEFDTGKLREKIQVMEALIAQRMQQLGVEGDSHAERVALNDALSILRVIQREKLNFPEWE